MKTMLAIAAAGMVAAAGPAFAQDQSATKAEVVERDASGKATKISIEGKVYAVCTETMKDECINPREAGLDFGDVPIDYWPGEPASQIDHPLPQHQPTEQAGN